MSSQAPRSRLSLPIVWKEYAWCAFCLTKRYLFLVYRHSCYQNSPFLPLPCLPFTSLPLHTESLTACARYLDRGSSGCRQTRAAQPSRILPLCTRALGYRNHTWCGVHTSRTPPALRGAVWADGDVPLRLSRRHPGGRIERRLPHPEPRYVTRSPASILGSIAVSVRSLPVA